MGIIQKIKYAGVAVASVFVMLGIVWSVMVIRNFFNPGSSPSTFITVSAGVIREIRALNRLETASFTVEKVIDAGTQNTNAVQEFLYGDRILLIAHGQVVAGFDLENLPEGNVSTQGKTIHLILPAPVILTTTLDNNQTRVYDRKLGILTKGDKDLEAKARTEAQQAIQDTACKGGILDEAAANARKQLTAFLKALGFETITIDIPEGSC